MKEKIIQIMLVVFLVFGLSACGSNEDSNQDDTAALVDAERVEEATIEFYGPAGKNTDYLLNAIDLYNEEFGTKLKLEPVDVAPGTPMVQKITPKLVADEKMPDLIFLEDSKAGAIFEKFESLFHSSEDYGFVEEYGDLFYPAKMNMLANIAPSGKTYGFPNDWGNAVMFYNHAAFEEAGVNIEEDVQTWDDFIEAGKKLKEKTGKKLLFMRDSGELDLVKYLTEQQGVSIFDKEGNLNLLDDAVLNAYSILSKIDEEDLVAYGNAEDYTLIGQDSGAIFAGGWLASYQAGDFPEDEGDWRIGKMPQVIEGEDIAPMSGGSSFYVPKNSDNGLAALQFISYVLTTPEVLDGYMELMGLPANMTAYDSEVAQKEFPYYGNQKILLTLNEIGKTSIEGYVFPYSADLDNYIEAASYDIKYNDVDVKEALEKQAKEFAEKYEVEIVE